MNSKENKNWLKDCTSHEKDKHIPIAQETPFKKVFTFDTLIASVRKRPAVKLKSSPIQKKCNMLGSVVDGQSDVIQNEKTRSEN